MAKKFLGFTPDQQFTLLSKMGYSGPKDSKSMEQFVAATPGAASKMGQYPQKAQERLNTPNIKLAEGGTVAPKEFKVTQAGGSNFYYTTPEGAQSQAYRTKEEAETAMKAFPGYTTPNTAPSMTTSAVTPLPAPVTSPTTVPQFQENLDAAQRDLSAAQAAATANPTDQAALTRLQAAQGAFTNAQNAFNMSAVPSGAEALSGAITNPQQLLQQAQAAQVQQTPDQLIAAGTGQVGTAPQAGVTTTGPAAQAIAPTATEAATVDATRVTPGVDAALEGLEAAQAQPSRAATVQGQLEGLMAQFEGGATPPWASGAMRQAMGVMQQRGLGASSVAGQAVVQAAMESAIAIASQDAATTAQFEMQNLNNRQQTTIFKTQQRIAGLFSDQAADNAAKQFNAASKNQTDQFFAGLQESVSRFNADQVNAIMQFNTGQTNAIEQFNTQLTAQRDQFNAQNSLIIAQANAKWRQDIATTNTAAQNEANMTNAKASVGLTSQAFEQLWQRERDLMAFAFQASENYEQRALQILLADKNISAENAARKSEEKSYMAATAVKLLFGGGGLFG